VRKVGVAVNVVFVSPHFPPNYYNFCVALRRAGVNVLGIADLAYDSLHYELRAALTEYFRADDMLDYDQLLRAVAFLTYRHGQIAHEGALRGGGYPGRARPYRAVMG
jgi:hypothetical protein